METVSLTNTLLTDTLSGLQNNPKTLKAKYFYDDEGSRIFEQIMHMPEYYPTRCEREIFTTQASAIVNAITNSTNEPFELVELGSGDGIKTRVLLKELIKNNSNFTYIPIDISRQAIEALQNNLKSHLPSLTINPLIGDYFKIMHQINGYSGFKKTALFLGANIGNYLADELALFLNALSNFLHRDDKILLGFDLKKSPAVIRKAYDDPHGLTRDFNLNLLRRLNRELGADFSLNHFEHHAEYNPITGYARSFLISICAQKVKIAASETVISFDKWEPIFMEVSRKFDLKTISSLAKNYGFKIISNFTDSKEYFVDSLWVKSE
ncbi:MAG: L-histidine N(alpha)-methyltransferase [Lentimicrobium sp.]|jgi:dimethylhistidine N-methyltransferase|nr:L-histidine N(alpha)-methyltransferase [Lentimicrobium sp.]MDY0025878.1 L-histidine N(alpha)-methyltransferase [Lentimicrobium sp.]